MNARQVLASGVVAAMLGFGPAIASAEPYFALFWGKDQIDVSQDELNTLATELTGVLGGTQPSGSSDLNDTDSVWGVQVGYRFNRWIAAEAGYVDLGKANYVATLTSDFGRGPEGYSAHGRFLSSGPTIAIVPMLPLGERFDVYGRAGIYFADTRFRVKFNFQDTAVFGTDTLSAEAKSGTQEFFGGLGFAWNINDDYAVRAEATYFLDVGDDDRTTEASITMLNVGFMFR